MLSRSDVAHEVLVALRAICSSLPEVKEEDAWVGTRWRVGKETFAHVVAIDDGWPPAYARAAGSDGPLTVLTFQAAADELDALTAAGRPFFRPPWRRGIVGLALGPDVDWAEVAELVTDSYCTLAPTRLVAQVARPTA